jgi:hypothetical protein
MIVDADPLTICRRVLTEGGFTVDRREVPLLGTVLIAETRDALAMIVVSAWQQIVEHVEEAQAQLTRLAAIHPSPRSWDLYIVIVVDRLQPRFDRVREQLEADTRYARKLVVAGVAPAIDRRLRALLPLRPVPHIELVEPMSAVRKGSHGRWSRQRACGLRDSVVF